MSFINDLANYNNQKSLANKFRNKRFHFFESQLIKLDNGKIITILDVGGTESFWVNRGYHEKPNVKITLLNLTKFETHYPNMISVKGNACDLSEYKEDEFDLVFSNSVIEHLYNNENQKLMAQEVQRVGKNHYIQTPYKYFFVEPHYLLPYFQFLPKKAKIFILSKTKLSRGTKISTEEAKDQAEQIVLVSKKRMKQLFPGSKIYKEKFLGMTKSLTAYSVKKSSIS
ncbi:class I SAM-dependent methyltransferase [Aequorivita todarodis]|uniref:class I SAM-dependent methyltransferase n=1 Tax=Aequorivita todarodis TaxID=2036821 RepID=UPI0023506719|nr:class I SAM-dependent methyltransferase [Aequorivita todarodis]MDC8002350.1 class I SAM-dependent methyltransferase [Aequorivita todarodis]